jgi:D-methionine transport system substrate-binding protein
MKSIKVFALITAAALALAACGSGNGDSPQERVTVKIGLTGEAENDIWAPVKEELAKEGIDIEMINFADYTLLNGALNDGELDLNAFQHYAYLNNQIADNGYKITAIGDTYISAMCIYSNKIKDVGELKYGDKIAIPNDTVNLGRALSVAQGAGIITLGGPANGSTFEISDITSNPLNIEFVQVDAAQIPALLPDVAAGVINGNYALDFGLSPQKDSIFYDDVAFYPDKRYVNNITAREADANNEVYLRIVRAYQSPAVEQVYRDKFDGSYLPGWKSTSASPTAVIGERVTVKLGVVGEMYQDLWAPAIAALAGEGIDVVLVSFGDYSLPNEALNNGDIDLNGFQHYAFLNNEIATKGYTLTPIGDTIMAAMCVYSSKISDVSELKNGDKIAIPNDAVNLGRALSVLQAAGVITLRDVDGSPEITDIISNPKNIELVEVDASQIYALLPDVAAGVINGNYAVDFGFKPLQDSIFYDDVSYYKDRRFVNVIAARTADADNAVYKRVVAAFQSPATEAVLRDQYTGTFLAAWK